MEFSSNQASEGSQHTNEASSASLAESQHIPQPNVPVPAHLPLHREPKEEEADAIFARDLAAQYESYTYEQCSSSSWPRRKVPPVDYTAQAQPYRRGIHHDRMGNLVVDGKKYILCDCLKVECKGCQWPCKRCGGRMCYPVRCQRNRKAPLLKVEFQGVVDGITTNPYVPADY